MYLKNKTKQNFKMSKMSKNQIKDYFGSKFSVKNVCYFIYFQ